MIFKDKKEEALGGNFKIKSIQVFGSKENLFRNTKKYRRVFDISECRYIYCELSFYNKLFDEKDWNAQLTFICTNTSDNKEICKLNKKVAVTKDKNILNIREGWGTPETGWWKTGTYRWDVLLDNIPVGNASFYIIDGGVVTPNTNPYFNIQEIRLFESPRQGMEIEKRNYLRRFDSDLTRFINIEMKLENTYTAAELFPLELQFNFYNDAGQLKAFMNYFKEIRDQRATIQLDSGYGADNPGYWYPDHYTLEVIFMDQLVAVVPFEVGDSEVTAADPLPFSTQVKREAGQEISNSKTLSFDDAKAELEGLIGLNSVKKQINELASYLQFLKVRKEKGLEEENSFSLHSVFTGNPGTGKTTVANMLGQIYRSLGLLTHGNVVEVGRADLVGEFIGQTAPKVKKAIDKARGGILFVDEAYALTNRGDDNKDFGREVIEVLLKELSDGEGDLAIIFAGYPREMQNFLNSNPGLASRLRNVIHFPDYSPDELLEIAEYTATKRGVLIDESAKEVIHQKLVDVYRNRNEHFGNARYVNGLIEESKQNMALRLMQEPEQLAALDQDTLSTILEEDVERIFLIDDQRFSLLPVDEQLLDDALTQLHQLVGLETIKKEVDEMTKLVRYYREIGKDISKSFNLHTIFTGNPGTGKTTVARLLVQIYKALGILERGHLIECDRKSLVAGFVGQTAIKTGELIDQALGGGLFIDEAYALTTGNQQDFGREAIETLLKRMEDQRGEFMVIVAGYPKEMQTFLEANPGLMSRFDKHFRFPDYSSSELEAIAELMFENEQLQLSAEAKGLLTDYIQTLVNKKHKYFGNARSIRKIVAETIRKQNLRMAEVPSEKRTAEMTSRIEADDVSGFKLVEDAEKKRGIGFRS